MKLLKSINKFKIVHFFLGVMFALPLLPSNLKSIAILLFSFSVVLLAFNRKRYFNKHLFFINTIVIFGIAITLLYSTDYDYAIRKLQTMSSLFVFPFLFSLFDHEERLKIIENNYSFLFIYIISVFLFNTTIFLWFYITHYNLSDILQHFPMIIMVDIGKFGIHPIYLSMHCCLAILFSISIFKKTHNQKLKGLLIFMNFVVFFFLIIYARKGPILALLLTGILWIFLGEKKQLKIKLSIIIILGLLFLLIPKTRKRFYESLSMGQTNSIESNSFSTRLVIYRNAIQLIKAAPLLGYGIGDFNEELNKTYKKKPPFLNKAYNSHNQYISFVIIGGLFLLLLYFIFMYLNIKISILNRNYIYIIILCFYSIEMLSENILERENGVIFFSFFLSFLSLNNYTKGE